MIPPIRLPIVPNNLVVSRIFLQEAHKGSMPRKRSNSSCFLRRSDRIAVIQIVAKTRRRSVNRMLSKLGKTSKPAPTNRVQKPVTTTTREG